MKEAPRNDSRKINTPRIEEAADYYTRLGLSQEATREEISDAFRKLSSQFHTDVHGGGNLEKMKLISEAYATLKDPKRRALYHPPAQSQKLHSTERRGDFWTDGARGSDAMRRVHQTEREGASEKPTNPDEELFQYYQGRIAIAKSIPILEEIKNEVVANFGSSPRFFEYRYELFKAVRNKATIVFSDMIRRTDNITELVRLFNDNIRESPLLRRYPEDREGPGHIAMLRSQIEKKSSAGSSK